MEVSDEIIEERRLMVEALERETSMLRDVFREMNQIVEEQSQTLRTLEDEYVIVEKNTVKALEELYEAERNHRSSSKKKLFLIAAAVLLGAVVLH